MRVIDMEYEPVEAGLYLHLERVRDLDDCTIWSAGTEQKSLLLEDPVNRRLVRFEYSDNSEFERDRRIVLAIDRDEGDAATGVGARLSPAGPVRSAGFAQQIPRPAAPDPSLLSVRTLPPSE